jgi:hypothetical protein
MSPLTHLSVGRTLNEVPPQQPMHGALERQRSLHRRKAIVEHRGQSLMMSEVRGAGGGTSGITVTHGILGTTTVSCIIIPAMALVEVGACSDCPRFRCGQSFTGGDSPCSCLRYERLAAVKVE